MCLEKIKTDHLITTISIHFHGACAQSLQSCPALCDPMDHSPPGSSVHVILYTRILEWVSHAFLQGSSWPSDLLHILHWQNIGFFTTITTGKPWIFPVCVLSPFSCVQLFATPGTVSCQAPAHGILQTRTLEWVAMPSSRGSSRSRDQTYISCVSCIADRFFTPEPPGKSQILPTSIQIYCFFYHIKKNFDLIFCSTI